MPYSTSRSTNKKFCKICFDRGLPPSKYESHYVRDLPGPKGVVVCPILKAAICSSCSRKGHTRSHCPGRTAQRSDHASRPKPKPKSSTSEDGFKRVGRKGSRSTRSTIRQPSVTSPKPQLATFALLEVDSTDSDSDSDTETVQADEVPAADNRVDLSAFQDSLFYVPAKGGSVWADCESDEEWQ